MTTERPPPAVPRYTRRPRRRAAVYRAPSMGWLMVIQAAQLAAFAGMGWAWWSTFHSTEEAEPDTRAVAAWVRQQVVREVQAMCPCLEPADAP